MIAWREASQHAGGLVSHVLERGQLAAVVRVGVKRRVDRDGRKVLLRKGVVQRVEDLGHGPGSDGLGAKILSQPLDSASDKLSPSGSAVGDALGNDELATHGCWRVGRRVLEEWITNDEGRLCHLFFRTSVATLLRGATP